MEANNWQIKFGSFQFAPVFCCYVRLLSSRENPCQQSTCLHLKLIRIYKKKSQMSSNYWYGLM